MMHSDMSLQIVRSRVNVLIGASRWSPVGIQDWGAKGAYVAGRGMDEAVAEETIRCEQSKRDSSKNGQLAESSRSSF